MMVGIAAAAMIIPAVFVSLYVPRLEFPLEEMPLPIIEAPVEQRPKQKTPQIPIQQQPVETPVQEPMGPDQVRSISHDILQISPGIYSYVKLALLSGTTIDENGDAHRDLSTVSVETIEISVKSVQWDSLDSNEKVALLHQTFRLLKLKYPDITEFIELKFDDHRKDLKFRFDEVLNNEDPRD